MKSWEPEYKLSKIHLLPHAHLLLFIVFSFAFGVWYAAECCKYTLENSCSRVVCCGTIFTCA